MNGGNWRIAHVLESLLRDFASPGTKKYVDPKLLGWAQSDARVTSMGSRMGVAYDGFTDEERFVGAVRDAFDYVVGFCTLADEEHREKLVPTLVLARLWALAVAIRVSGEPVNDKSWLERGYTARAVADLNAIADTQFRWLAKREAARRRSLDEEAELDRLQRDVRYADGDDARDIGARIEELRELRPAARI